MALSSGTRLGPYEILAPIGAGGMGEVYKAKDTRLDRNVAIKVLPSHLADNPDLKQRFEREARAVSSLNHPHICTLYEFDTQDGVDFLVMEFIEGETLADRLKKGALSLDQALRHGIEIADALDKAHRQGVVHRDLKPGNIMLTKSGTKLLDFGLAKLKVAESGREASVLSALPTEEKPLTEKGSIIGTFQYMAPEQLEGKDADARTDIFAFGAVLYEMLTGRKAFEGKSQASLISAIMKDDPPVMSTLQPMTPTLLERTVKKCLAKEPDKRWQSAQDLHDELKFIAEAGSEAGVPAAARPGSHTYLAWGLSLFLAVVVTGFAAWNLKPPPLRPVVRFEVSLPSTDELRSVQTPAVALSPDGEHLVYVANEQLYLRAMDEVEATPMRGTEGGLSPFFSPDGQWVGFWVRGGDLKKVPLSGGPPLRLCSTLRLGGVTWGPDDTIVFADYTNIYRVPAAGGEPHVLIASTAGERYPRDPEILPDGETLLFTVTSGDDKQIVAQSLNTNERSVLIEGGSDPRYLSTGHLIYFREDTLLAVPFDPVRVEVKGNPVPLVGGVSRPTVGSAQFSVSRSGGLVYMTGGQTSLVPAWVDRLGNVGPLPVPATDYLKPSLSPDGGRLALQRRDADARDIWVYDLGRGSFSRFTFVEGGDWWPAWSPDGRYVTFGSDRSGADQLFRKRADGSGDAEALTEALTDVGDALPGSWSPDGRTLVYTVRGESLDLWTLSLDENDLPGSPQPFLETPFGERDAAFSPDGRWLAYMSDESGRWEVFVRPFPKGEGKWQVSTEGGWHPVWARDTLELFYRNGDKMMVVDYAATGDAFRAEPPRELFTVPTMDDVDYATYDVSADGQRFLVLLPKESDEAPRQLIVVLNWFEELKRLIPTEN